MGGVNRSLAAREEVTENVYIIDVEVDPSRKEEIFDAISRGVRLNAPGISISKPIVMGPLPSEPGRFELTDPLAGSSFQSLAALSGTSVSFRVPKCDGAALVGAAQKNSRAHDLRMHVCLFPYEDGFSMNVFTASTGRRSGGLTGLVEDATTSVIGDSNAWEEITVRDMISTVRSLDAVDLKVIESSKDF